MLFQPNRAEYNLHDPAIAHLRSIASHNGFGELVLVHGVPLHSLYPGDAIEMARVAAAGGRRETRVLQTNLKVIAEEVRGADAVLLGWGARARKCSAWFDQVLHTVRTNLDGKASLYCIETTANGFPMNPLAKGVCAIPPTAQLLAWQ